jgi:hypothetical protein
MLKRNTNDKGEAEEENESVNDLLALRKIDTDTTLLTTVDSSASDLNLIKNSGKTPTVSANSKIVLNMTNETVGFSLNSSFDDSNTSSINCLTNTTHTSTNSSNFGHLVNRKPEDINAASNIEERETLLLTEAPFNKQTNNRVNI